MLELRARKIGGPVVYGTVSLIVLKGTAACTVEHAHARTHAHTHAHTHARTHARTHAIRAKLQQRNATTQDQRCVASVGET